MKSELLAYAVDFTSFLLQKTNQKEKIKNIILFGSVARGEAEKESDVDLFIDIIKEDKKLEKQFQKIVEEFYSSAKYTSYWQLLDINNEIKLTIGELEKWEELQPSINANGILLYGKFIQEIKKGTHKTFFIWENVKPNAKRVLFNKQLFGHNVGGKFYEGLLQKYQGQRLGKGCILVDAHHSTTFHQLFKKNNMPVKIKKVVEY